MKLRKPNSLHRVLCLAILVGGGLWLSIRVGGRSDVDRRLADLAVHKPSPRHTAQFNADMDVIWNLLGHKRMWDRGDVETLAKYAAVPVTFSGDDWEQATLDQIEAAGVQGAAYTILSDRIMRELPMDSEARALAVATLLSQLENPNHWCRVASISGVVQAGLIDSDPVLRARIAKMKSDPSPDVAANAAGQLAHRDRVLATRAAAAKRNGTH